MNSNNDIPDEIECWCLSKGMAGMTSQMVGLAEAVGVSYTLKKTRLGFPWRWMPMGLIPRSRFSLADPSLLKTDSPPRLVISCGRHGVIPALALKRQYGDQIFSVHIQDPKTDASALDLIVVPKHDYLRGPNVYLTTGAIHHITPERLAAARRDPQYAQITAEGRPVVAVLIGGPNGYYSFSTADIDRFVTKLHQTALESNAKLVLLPSNRTPVELNERLDREFGARHYVWNRSAPNPYFPALAAATHLIVTGDSVSMVTEAAATGRPVFVEYLTERRKATRFRDFHAMFQQDGITRPFDGTLADWSYQPPNDTPQVAQIIKQRISAECQRQVA